MGADFFGLLCDVTNFFQVGWYSENQGLRLSNRAVTNSDYGISGATSTAFPSPSSPLVNEKDMKVNFI